MSVAAQEPKPSADLAELSKLIRLPPGVVGARWWVRAVRPPGSRLVPGPTDTVLIAYLQLSADAWPALATVLRTRGAATRPIPAADAKALLPAPMVASMPRQGEKVVLSGTEVDATSLGTSLYRAVGAVKLGNDIYATFRTQ